MEFEDNYVEEIMKSFYIRLSTHVEGDLLTSGLSGRQQKF